LFPGVHEAPEWAGKTSEKHATAFIVYLIDMRSMLVVDFGMFFGYTRTMNSKGQRRGRPRKSSGATKSESLLLRMATAEKTAFQEAADIAGVPLSVWMRERLRWAATRELQTAGRLAAFLTAEEE
jgi:hypothetical protein